MNKKGIELSINFLVIMIISILILILSIIFLKNLFTAAYQKQAEVDLRTEEQIKALIRDGEKVALPLTTLQIRRGESDVFGLGILNIKDTGKDFYINVEYVTGYDVDGIELFPTDNFQILYRDTVEGLPANSEAILGISISTPSSGIESGTYIFNAVVCYADCCPQTEPGCSADECPSGVTGTSDTECTDWGVLPDLYDNIVHKLYVEVP